MTAAKEARNKIDPTVHLNFEEKVRYQVSHGVVRIL